jgi:deazaflavin-dependent oxidoreductase (nitroreductase family)
MLSASQLPVFLLRPPRGYGVLTTTGRKSGKVRRRCVRVVREADQAFIVAINDGREIKGWMANALANEEVGLRLTEGSFRGPARLVQEPDEVTRAKRAYAVRVFPFDYLAFVNHCKGLPTEGAIRNLLVDWFQEGKVLAVGLGPDARSSS